MGFKKGNDPNRNTGGRPRGARSANTLMSDALKEYGATGGFDVVQKIIELVSTQALAGCVQSQSMILSRISPQLKSVLPMVSIPSMPQNDLLKSANHIITLIANEQLSPDIGKELLSGITSVMTITEKTDYEKRLQSIEATLKENKL